MVLPADNPLTNAMVAKIPLLMNSAAPSTPRPAPRAPHSSPLSWIITGGVACGKSTVMRLLEEMLGSRLRSFSSDAAVHALYEDSAIVERLRARFGPDMPQTAGTEGVDRQWLAERVFADPAARRDLEAILHPPVLAALEAARAAARSEGTVNLFVAEVPLYHEIGATVAADHVIVVASSQDRQIRRLMQHRGLDQTRSEAMLAAQWPVLDKAAKASQVIWNDGDKRALEDQVAALTRFLDRP